MLCAVRVQAQEDTTLLGGIDLENVPLVETDDARSPRRAALLSTAFPGGGQIYNRQYWKLPIVWGGFAGAGYAIFFNTQQYNRYLDAYRLRTDGNPNTIDEFDGTANPDVVRGFTVEQLERIQDVFRRNRDLSIILTTLGYVLQIADAYAIAHLA
ncbi:MAG: DUF5683 domain-containing protein, partial [Catalinimonas sp.]